MTRLTFDTAEALVYDPVSSNRNATRTALYTLGFRRIESVATAESFLESVRRRPPDLTLCEVQGTELGVCDMIQELRQGVAAYNPFIVIIVTTWEQSSALVSRVLNSGADDLLLRPFSTTTLGARIRTHIEKRKGFVVTSDYIGPDRRRDGARQADINILQPPNSLRMKALERLTAEEAAQRLDRELKEAREQLTSEKVKRDAFQLCVLWRLMQENLSASASLEIDILKVREKARAISRRCLDTEYERAAEWCESILAALEGLEVGVDRNASMHLLGHAALNLCSAVSPEKTEKEHLEAIDATIALIKTRVASKLASAS